MTESIFSTINNYSSPYREPITEIFRLLENAQIINPDNKQLALKIAQDYLEENSNFISIEWHIEDVFEIAEQSNLKINEEQALEVLDFLEDKHDANYGISWDTIHYALNHLSFDSED